MSFWTLHLGIQDAKRAQVVVRAMKAPWVRAESEWKNNVDLNPADVLTDIGNCKLPKVQEF